ncbi:hypothetical protein Cfor_12077, partial [Coptotermes formosanus]
MDVQIQRRELNAGALRVSSVKDFCVDIKYEEHADTTGFPLIVCVDQQYRNVSKQEPDSDTERDTVISMKHEELIVPVMYPLSKTEEP